MPLESVQTMAQKALAEGYALGYFESWGLESLQGVIDAAERTNSPIIIGFNGDYLSRPERNNQERISWYAELGKAAAESATVPCGLIFNECAQDDATRLAIEIGFNLVMPADPEASYGDYVQRVADLTRYAHEHGVAVEGELGELPCGSSGQVEEMGSVTDPDVAAQFVETTNVDLLAVSVGNVHVMVKGERDLDLGHLAELHRKLDIPLVLHGGSGISAGSLQKAVSLGIAKVNFGTYIKQRYIEALREALKSTCQDPHRLLGYGGRQDIMVIGRRAVCEAVLERIKFLGCCGKA